MSNSLRSKVIRLAHANPALRPHLLPLLKTAGRPPLMMVPGFKSFDASDVFDSSEIDEPTPKVDPKASISRELGGGQPRMMPLSVYLRPGSSTQGIDNAIWYWERKGWAVETTARNEVEALRTGQKLQKSLLPPTKVSASDPYVHNLPLFVIYGDGQWTRLAPKTR